ncbi:MAG: GC-type dockerin domain-anchored protein, partial [Phycisphaerales bacterium]
SSGDSALPRTMSEFLTINDDDGNVNNGTPDLCEISSAFLQHGIEVDGFSSNVSFSYSPGTPAIMTPGATQPFTLSVGGLCKVPVAGTARIHWRNAASGTFTSALLSSATPNNYTGEIVAPPCAAGQIQYYFSVSTATSTGVPSGIVVYPSTNGTTPAPIVALVSTGSTISGDDFESDRGWVVGPNTAPTGAWVRVDPNGTAAQPEDDHSESGTTCFVTGQGSVGGTLGEADIDGGSTILTSPAYNFASASDVLVSYWRWYSNGAGAAPYEDTFRVDVSNDNGATWTNAETVGPANGPNTNGGWVQASWSLSSKGKVPTGQVKIRFTAEDLVNGSLVEAAVDDVQFSALVCVDAPPCPADYNQDGGVDGSDIQSFFIDWQAGTVAADVNQDGGVDGGDIETFFVAWQAGGC